MDQKWTSISSALYEAAAQSMGYKSKNHQDWFDDNSDTIHNIAEEHVQRPGNPKQPLIQHHQAGMAESSTRSSEDYMRIIQSILIRWAEHSDSLLNQDSDAVPTILDELPEPPPIHNLRQPLTFQEVLSAVHSLKNKSPGTEKYLQSC